MSLGWLMCLTLKRPCLSPLLLSHLAPGFETSFHRMSGFLRGIFRFARAGPERDPVALELTIQRRTADSEHSPRERLVSIGLLKYAQNRHLFHFREGRCRKRRRILNSAA